MTDDHDPLVASMFADAERGFDDPDFIDAVMKRIRSRRRRVLFARALIVAALIALEVVLESPLQNSLGILGEVLGDPLIAINDGWINYLLSPVNSIAGLIGLTLLGLNLLYRRIVH